LSLAGYGAGLAGDRSGTFWPFWKIVEQLIEEGRRPNTIIVENVCGTLNSHGGRDFKAICDAFSNAGFKFGAVVIDAANFVPQSRPRLFVIGVTTNATIPKKLISHQAIAENHPRALVNAHKLLSRPTAKNWIWWKLPAPQKQVPAFADFVEENPADVSWDSLEETRKILSQMSPLNLAKVQSAQMKRQRLVGCIYKRTRHDQNGIKVQRAEVRFDDVAGCLRTPKGGSSRQRILVVQGNKIRTRLLSAREAARLMGLPESYILPSRYNDAYHLTGDGVAVPVVRWLAQHIIEQILTSASNTCEVAMAAA
jgi:DNA (cytosine-5)-methyltransferase 1